MVRNCQLEQLVINVDNLAAWQYQEWGVILWGPGLITEGVWIRYDQPGGASFIEFLRKQTVQQFTGVPLDYANRTETENMGGLLEPEFIAELGAVPAGETHSTGDDSGLDGGDEGSGAPRGRRYRRGG